MRTSAHRGASRKNLLQLSIHPNSNRDFSPFFGGSIYSSQQPAGYTQKPQAAVHKSQASPAPQNDERPFLPLYFLLVFLYLTRLENSLVYTKTSLVSRVRVACLRGCVLLIYITYTCTIATIFLEVGKLLSRIGRLSQKLLKAES